jgi:hypothetical protein
LLDPIVYPIIQIRADFNGYATKKPTLDSWSINWSKNHSPEIIEIVGPSSMYRGDTEVFTVYVTDEDENSEHLNIEAHYMEPADDRNWSKEFFKEPTFSNGLWFIEFSPSSTAEIGSYDFRFDVTDFFGRSASRSLTNVLEVTNRPPPAPEVILSPSIPKSEHDLTCFVNLPPKHDESDYSMIFRWFRNSVLQPELVSNNVSSELTHKNDVWRCEVSLFDGFDEGIAGYAEVVIGNTAPEVVNIDSTQLIYEDTKNTGKIILSDHFYDQDNDVLDFTILPADNLVINYDQIEKTITFTPEPNWYGNTVVTVYASDDTSDISKSFIITVWPSNDPPSINAIGNLPLFNYENKDMIFNALKAEELRLQVSAFDIDRDELTYSSNKSDGVDDDDIESFNMNEDTGLITFVPSGVVGEKIWINISVSDNNGSTVWRDIAIVIQSSEEEEFQQLLLSSDWMMVIIAVILICFIYYGVIISRTKLKAYMKKRYQRQLTGTGRLYANYPIAITSKDQFLNGRYPGDDSSYRSFTHPYRAALYTYQPEASSPQQKEGTPTEDEAKVQQKTNNP